MTYQELPAVQARLPTEERQAEIVAAALRLANSSSPALITTGDLADAIGVTQGAVFKHFPTKDAIWLAAMRWVRETLLTALHNAVADAATPNDALRSMFETHVEFVIAHPGVPRFIFHELQQPADSPAKLEVRAVMQGYRQLLLAVLNQALAQRSAGAQVDPEAAATAFIGLIQGLVMQSMLSGRPAAMRRQAGQMFALYLRGIGAAS